jgi:hypothetical protein
MSNLQHAIWTLREFNLWRRSDEDMDQPDPWEIGKAIDDAIEAMEKLGRLTDAAQAVVDRWETPFWKDHPPTALVMNKLRKALAAVDGGLL